MSSRSSAARGESLEAAAREARYRALASQLAGDRAAADRASPGRSARDRAAGAAARQRRARLGRDECGDAVGAYLLLRPLLPVTRTQLEQYARERALDWSEDPSNADERFDRNYLRRAVLPLLRQRWPAVAATVSRSAAHLAEARSLLEQMARRRAGRWRAMGPGAARQRAAAHCHCRSGAMRCVAGSPSAACRRRIIGGCARSAARCSRRRGMPLPRCRWQGGTAAPSRRSLCSRLPSIGVAPSPSARVERLGLAQAALAAAGRLAARSDWCAIRHGEVRADGLAASTRACAYRRGGERLQGAHGHMRAQGSAAEARPGAVGACRPCRWWCTIGLRIIAVADLWLDPHYRCHGRPGGRRVAACDGAEAVIGWPADYQRLRHRA